MHPRNQKLLTGTENGKSFQTLFNLLKHQAIILHILPNPQPCNKVLQVKITCNSLKKHLFVAKFSAKFLNSKRLRQIKEKIEKLSQVFREKRQIGERRSGKMTAGITSC